MTVISQRAFALVIGWLLLTGALQPVGQQQSLEHPRKDVSAPPSTVNPAIGKSDEVAGALDRLTSAVAVFTENSKADAAQKDERERRDLVAQEDMALWAKYMLWSSVAQAAISIFGIWLLYKTFRETRRAANASDGMARDSRLAAQAAIESVKIAQSTNRPWIQLDAVVAGPAWVNLASVEAELLVRMTCHGTMPATEVHVRSFLFERPALGSHHLKDVIAQIVQEKIIDLRKYPPRQGYVLFPGTQMEQKIEGRISFKFSDNVNWTSVELMVAIFVYYKFGQNSGHTVKVYRLMRTGRESRSITLERGANEHIPAGQLELIEGIYGHAD